MKEDYLHHFSLPRIDLLVWVMVTKLAPRYYQKIDVMLTVTKRRVDSYYTVMTHVSKK